MAKKPTPPKGKVKGGARFPRHDLKACFSWAQKLVSKTHNGPQPQDVILAGVVERKGPEGKVKVSAMKQFGLIDGDPSAYEASPLAKAVVNCPEEERPRHLQKCVLLPALFQPVFDTFQGDKTSLAKIRQRFTDLNVHPDNADNCVKIYTTSLEYAGLGTLSCDQFEHASSVGLAQPKVDEEESPEEADLESPDNGDQTSSEEHNDLGSNSGGDLRKGSASVRVNVTIDSSLDTEKLEKQLQLLKKYGAL